MKRKLLNLAMLATAFASLTAITSCGGSSDEENYSSEGKTATETNASYDFYADDSNGNTIFYKVISEDACLSRL